MKHRFWSLGIAILFGWTVTGCRSFHREWQQARHQPAPTDDLTGAWEGTWQNQNNTHQDRMRAVLTRTSPDTYQASFFAWYKRVLTFSYCTELRVERRDGATVFFHGASDLGKLAGGIYRYEGHATPFQYFSTYDSKYDVGTFTLHRPEPQSQTPHP